jgi:hypothetical protein
VRGVIDRADPREEWHGHCALPRAIEEALGPPHNDHGGLPRGIGGLGPDRPGGHQGPRGVHTAVR